MGKIRNRGRTDVKKGLVRQGNVVGDRHEQRELRGVSKELSNNIFNKRLDLASGLFYYVLNKVFINVKGEVCEYYKREIC